MAEFDFSTLALDERDLKTFDTGETLFSTGESGTSMYVIKSGSVDIRVGGKVFDTVHSGGVVGEMALIDNAPRSADAIAREPCSVIEVDERMFAFLVSETPFFALQVMRIMADRLRRMNQSA